MNSDFSVPSKFSDLQCVYWRIFIGILSRGRNGKNYGLSVSVKDPGFYLLYSTLVVPELRIVDRCQEDIDAINNYLRIGDAPLLMSLLERSGGREIWYTNIPFVSVLYGIQLNPILTMTITSDIEHASVLSSVNIIAVLSVYYCLT